MNSGCMTTDVINAPIVSAYSDARGQISVFYILKSTKTSLKAVAVELFQRKELSNCHLHPTEFLTEGLRLAEFSLVGPLL